MGAAISYYRTAERPDLKFWLLDEDGDLIDFSTGYTFSFKLGDPGEEAEFTATSGITGAAGSGDESDGTPNITVSFSSGDLDDLTPGPYTWQLTATDGNSLDRTFQGAFLLLDVIT